MMLLIPLLLSVPIALAQTSNAICKKNETTSFLFNANNESPCLVWAKLQSLCLRSERYINVPPLVDGTWGYNPVMPDEKDSLCQCNVVAYALMAGCSYCQVGDTASWVTEQRWRQDCSAYNDTSVSFAQIVLPFPAYAFRPWRNLRWNPTDALSAARGPPTAAPTVGTTTFFRSFPPGPTSTSPTPNSSPTPTDTVENDDPSNHARTGAIIGGVVGGVILLIIIMLLLAYWKKQHRFAQDQENGIEGQVEGRPGRKRGVPVGLPLSAESDPYAQGRGAGPTTALVAMLRGAARDSKAAGAKGTDRVSRWSESFFVNPRKAPARPAKTASRYTTTTERRRDKGASSSTSGGSSFDATFDQSTAPSPMSPWEQGQSRAGSVQYPRTASVKPSPLRNPVSPHQPDSPPDSDDGYQSAHRHSVRASPRKPVPRPPPRESFADRWSDQSSVFTFATKKQRDTLRTLPSFSTSVKEIKDHRTALAKKVTDDEAREQARDERNWTRDKELPPDPGRGERDPSSPDVDVVLGSATGEKGSKKKSKKSGSRSPRTPGEVDDSGAKLKKKKKKKRSSNTPGLKGSSTDTIGESPMAPSAISHTRSPGTAKSPITRRKLSTYSTAPSDVPEYAHKSLPLPPITYPTEQALRSPGMNHQPASIDFSLAAPHTPLSPRSRVSHPFAKATGRSPPTPGTGRVSFPEPQTARMTVQTVDIEVPDPQAYASRPSSTQPLSVSREGRRGPRDTSADFSDPRPSPRSALPSLYEPRTGAAVYHVPPVPQGRRGEEESESGSPVSRYPVSVLQVAN